MRSQYENCALHTWLHHSQPPTNLIAQHPESLHKQPQICHLSQERPTSHQPECDEPAGAHAGTNRAPAQHTVGARFTDHNVAAGAQRVSLGGFQKQRPHRHDLSRVRVLDLLPMNVAHAQLCRVRIISKFAQRDLAWSKSTTRYIATR